MTKEDCYDLDDLIKRLEKIRDMQDGGYINFPKAFYTLALEIKSLHEKIKSTSQSCS